MSPIAIFRTTIEADFETLQRKSIPNSTLRSAAFSKK